MGYFEAHRERMQRNDKSFRHLAKHLKLAGCTVLAPSHGLINFIVVLKDGKNLTIEFREVPFRWACYRSIKPSKEHGSSVHVDERGSDEGLWASYQILEMMRDDEYKKDYSWLIEL